MSTVLAQTVLLRPFSLSQLISPVARSRCLRPLSTTRNLQSVQCASSEAESAVVFVGAGRPRSCLVPPSSTKLAPPKSNPNPLSFPHFPPSSVSLSSASSSSASNSSLFYSSSSFPSSSFSSSSSFLSSSPHNTQLIPSHRHSSPVNRAALLSRHFSSASAANDNTDSSMSYAKSPSEYTVRKVGQPQTLDFRAYIEKDGQPVSPLHDIPLYANEQQTILNMVVEIPRWTNAKLEISKEEFLNPIKQDVKKGKLRYVRNCFPHKGYLWNYGAFPRTWEDPNVVHPETKAKGDNDPLDVCEIGELVGYTGQVKQVKVLGVMALLDEEETDWKIIVIDINDPLAPKLNDIEDVERHLPGLLRATNEWFRIYKIPDGKPENQFAFSGECKNKKYAMEVVHECADAWEKLMSGKSNRGDISLANTSSEQSPDWVDSKQVNLPDGQNLPPAPIDGSVDKWFFISGAAV
ncbi:inorganic pyrophosphatase [Paracoccidioides lutzii Pb01]|uniref:Inorganic pyrophosphatase n=1 Tax=Paracoccidioides lutzii (strain ATCC MYA-826 / Pb01) TaxID=502779 RepID=C1GQ62_PARBA|nr:inorganic pyrophosphatase [Paracoccidioides lutzii Pb01]EEH37736.2 inorganic pyrophosphatase [Paracoccidioides lutzii Pb01]